MIYVCGVLGGLVTGQSQTTQMIYRLLRKKYENKVHLIEQPYRFSFPIFASYYYKVFCYLLFGQHKVIYLSVSRSVKSFYARDLIIFILALVLRHTCIIHLVGNDLDKLLKKSRLALFTYKLILSSHRNSIIVLSDRMELQVADLLNVNIDSLNSFILPGFVDIKIDYEKIKLYDRHADNSTITIGFMSNLIPEKGIFDFIESIDLFKNSNLDLKSRFWVAGVKQRNIDYAPLDEKILNGTVEYYDFVDGEEKSKLLYETHVFVLPSYYATEALPLSLVQAAAHGTAIISCATGDIEMICKISNGTLVPAKNPNAIFTAYLNFIDNSEFDAVATSQSVCSYFSTESYASNLYAIFDMECA